MKLFMVGVCEHCGKEIRRPYPADTAACQCTNEPTVVKLKPERNRFNSREHPLGLACPDCGQHLIYRGNNCWECENPQCKVIRLNLKEDPPMVVAIKRAVI